LEERATSDNHEWYELQQPQFAYTSFLAGPKVMWPQITNRPSFSVDVNGFYVNNKVYFIPVENVDSAYYLMAILNSNISWNIITSIATPKLNDYFELFSGVIERIAVPTAQLPESQVLETLAKTLSSNSAAERMTLEAELNEHVAALYGLTAEEQHLIRRDRLDKIAEHLDEEEE
jgi:hypothetical protein